MILMIVLVFIPAVVLSQKGNPVQDCYRDSFPGRDKVFSRVENRPHFKGGVDALLKYLLANINFQKLVNNLQQNEKVYNDTARVKFIISRDGIVSNLTVSLSKKKIFENEIYRVIKKSACSWRPGDFGRIVDSWLQIDICYSLDRTTKEPVTKINFKEYNFPTN